MCVKQDNEQRNQVVYLTNHMEETERFPTTVNHGRAMMLSAFKVFSLIMPVVPKGNQCLVKKPSSVETECFSHKAKRQ